MRAWTLVLRTWGFLIGRDAAADARRVGILRFDFPCVRIGIAAAAVLAAACLFASFAAAGVRQSDALTLTGAEPPPGATSVTVELHSEWRRRVAIEQLADGRWVRLASKRPDRQGAGTLTVEPRPTGGPVHLRAHLRSRRLVSAVATVDMGGQPSVPAEQPATPGGQPAAATPPTPPVAPADIPVGFNNNAVTDKVATPAQAAGLLASVGADIDRVQVSWEQLEPRDGEFRFSTYDSIYAADLARGIRPLFIFAFAPDWASGGVCAGVVSGCHAPPTPAHYDDAAEAAAKLAARYPEAAGIEIWNEPNTPYFWQPAPDPAAYAELLSASADAIHAVDPDMPVAGGSMASGAAGSAGKISAPHFLAAMYASDPGLAPDAISIHVYPNPTVGSAVAWVERVAAIRDQNGDAATPIWITETGISTTGAGAVSEEAQADMTVGLDQSLRAIPGVEMLLFHTLVEPPRGPANTETGFGLVTGGLTKKPAYCALGASWGRAEAC